MNIDKAMATSDYDCQERRDELTWLANQASSCKMICEVGSWKGTTARAMADNTTGFVYAVDTWKGSVGEEASQKVHEGPEDWLYEKFIENTADLKNLVSVRMTSLEAATQFAAWGYKFNLIFIDASHDFESVKADILAWRPLLAPGGMFCGHDRGWEGVAKAVSELIPKTGVGAGAIWYEIC